MLTWQTSPPCEFPLRASLSSRVPTHDDALSLSVVRLQVKRTHFPLGRFFNYFGYLNGGWSTSALCSDGGGALAVGWGGLERPEGKRVAVVVWLGSLLIGVGRDSRLITVLRTSVSNNCYYWETARCCRLRFTWWWQLSPYSTGRSSVVIYSSSVGDLTPNLVPSFTQLFLLPATAKGDGN